MILTVVLARIRKFGVILCFLTLQSVYTSGVRSAELAHLSMPTTLQSRENRTATTLISRPTTQDFLTG